jgi:hypothetical protein
MMNDEQVRNFKWIGSHYEELTKKYNNKWVAVLGEKVVESDTSATALKMKVDKRYREEKERIRGVIFEFVTDKKFPEFDN